MNSLFLTYQQKITRDDLTCHENQTINQSLNPESSHYKETPLFFGSAFYFRPVEAFISRRETFMYS